VVDALFGLQHGGTRIEWFPGTLFRLEGYCMRRRLHERPNGRETGSGTNAFEDVETCSPSPSSLCLGLIITADCVLVSYSAVEDRVRASQ